MGESSKSGKKASWLDTLQRFRNRRVTVYFKEDSKPPLRGTLIDLCACNITIRRGMLWWSKKTIISYGQIADIKR
ncbi:MAG: hypothetical protein Q8Q39_04090 [bacterium]|nr:hypothetical protein [bacterium]